MKKIYVHYEGKNGPTFAKVMYLQQESLKSIKIRSVGDDFVNAYNVKFPSQIALKIGEYQIMDPSGRKLSLDSLLYKLMESTFDFFIERIDRDRNSSSSQSPNEPSKNESNRKESTRKEPSKIEPSKNESSKNESTRKENEQLISLSSEISSSKIQGFNTWSLQTLELAEDCKNQGNFQQASEIWELVAQVDPHNFLALYNLGNLAFQNGIYKKALLWYVRAMKESTSSVKLVELLVQQGQCQHHRKKYEKAIEIFEKAIQKLSEIEITCLDKEIDKAKETQYCDQDSIKVWIAMSLYEMDQAHKQMALKLLKEILHQNEYHPMALLLFSKILHKQDPTTSMQIILKLIAMQQYKKQVQETFAAFLQSSGGLDILRKELTPCSNTAPVYAVLAIIAKNMGAVMEARDLSFTALEYCPSSPTYALNLIHMLEICNQYDESLAVIQEYCKMNKNCHFGGLQGPQVQDVLNVISDSLPNEINHCKNLLALQSIAIINTPESKSLLNTPESVSLVNQIPSPSQDQKPKSMVENILEDEKKLDLLALMFSLVKILYLRGEVTLLPKLIHILEPVRCNRELHKTSIRNEHAYYCCISQLVSKKKKTFTIKNTCQNSIYVCGDSHSLALAWEVIHVHGEDRLFLPALVTGLKHWHLREDTNFYPKKNFYYVVDAIPRHSSVIFLFGEIDCREGILLAVQKGRYKNIEEGMHHTIGIFMQAIEKIIEKYSFQVFIHPVVPVLNETRTIVNKYNAIYKKVVESHPKMIWLDFVDDLLFDNKTKLKKEYQLDGTHLHPRYIRLLENAFLNIKTT